MCTEPSLNLGRLQGHDRSVELPRPGGLYFILQGNVQPLAGKVHEGIISSSDFTLTSRPLQTHFMDLNLFFYTDKLYKAFRNQFLKPTQRLEGRLQCDHQAQGR